MIAVEKTALLLLAAGRSTRFGDTDKLAEPFLGRPLAFHVTTALEDMPFLERIVVKDGTALDFTTFGCRVIHNERPEAGLSHSVRLGIAAVNGEAEAVLIVLADMPRVTAAHVYRMFDVAIGPDAVVASSNGEHPCPPVLFGRDQFEALRMLDGEEGARAMVRSGRHVVTSPAELVDVDTPDDLARLRAQFEPPIRDEARRSD